MTIFQQSIQKDALDVNLYVSVIPIIILFVILGKSLKLRSHKQLKFHLFNCYMVDLVKQDRIKLDFPNYQNYNDISKVYNDFVSKIKRIIDNVALLKERRLKQNFQECLDGIIGIYGIV